MKNQLIPPPGMEPPSIRHLPMADKIALWARLVDESHELLLAGLRHKIGPDGDLKAAYREWFERYSDEHDRTMAHMLSELSRREKSHAE